MTCLEYEIAKLIENNSPNKKFIVPADYPSIALPIDVDRIFKDANVKSIPITKSEPVNIFESPKFVEPVNIFEQTSSNTFNTFDYEDISEEQDVDYLEQSARRNFNRVVVGAGNTEYLGRITTIIGDFIFLDSTFDDTNDYKIKFTTVDVTGNGVNEFYIDSVSAKDRIFYRRSDGIMNIKSIGLDEHILLLFEEVIKNFKSYIEKIEPDKRENEAKETISKIFYILTILTYSSYIRETDINNGFKFSYKKFLDLLINPDYEKSYYELFNEITKDYYKLDTNQNIGYYNIFRLIMNNRLLYLLGDDRTVYENGLSKKELGTKSYEYIDKEKNDDNNFLIFRTRGNCLMNTYYIMKKFINLTTEEEFKNFINNFKKINTTSSREETFMSKTMEFSDLFNINDLNLHDNLFNTKLASISPKETKSLSLFSWLNPFNWFYTETAVNPDEEKETIKRNSLRWLYSFKLYELYAYFNIIEENFKYCEKNIKNLVKIVNGYFQFIKKKLSIRVYEVNIHEYIPQVFGINDFVTGPVLVPFHAFSFILGQNKDGFIVLKFVELNNFTVKRIFVSKKPVNLLQFELMTESLETTLLSELFNDNNASKITFVDDEKLNCILLCINNKPFCSLPYSEIKRQKISYYNDGIEHVFQNKSIYDNDDEFLDSQCYKNVEEFEKDYQKCVEEQSFNKITGGENTLLQKIILMLIVIIVVIIVVVVIMNYTHTDKVEHFKRLV